MELLFLLFGDLTIELRATQCPYQRIVSAALIAFAGIWREKSQLIRLSFPFF